MAIIKNLSHGDVYIDTMPLVLNKGMSFDAHYSKQELLVKYPELYIFESRGRISITDESLE